jgi:hypothetical protein
VTVDRGLAPVEVADLLEATLATVEAEVGALPESALVWHPAPGEWCVNEVLGHLIEAERNGFAGRIRLILDAEGTLALPSWNQVEVARARADCQRPSPEVVREFVQLRRDSVGLARGLREADLERGGEHPQVGFLRIGDLIHEWVHHDRNHVRQLLANVEGYVWPAMGNAQRFSLPH